MVKKLSSRRILGDEIQMSRIFDYFVQLDDVWMANQLQDLNLSTDSFDITVVSYLFFFKNFDGYSFFCEGVKTESDFSESSLPEFFAWNETLNLQMP